MTTIRVIELALEYYNCPDCRRDRIMKHEIEKAKKEELKP
jgi:hypothetical protein